MLIDINMKDAIFVTFLYIVFSWMLMRRSLKKMTLWFEVLFRLLFPFSICFLFIYFNDNYYMIMMGLPTLAFWAMSRRGKPTLRENDGSSRGDKLIIMSEYGEEPNDTYAEVWEDSSQTTYDIQEIMTYHAKRLGPDFYNECKEIIDATEGGAITLYHSWLDYHGKFEYIEFMYLHLVYDEKIPKIWMLNGVMLEPEKIFDKNFKVFFCHEGKYDPRMLIYYQKYKHVLEQSKMIPKTDDYMALQDENDVLKTTIERMRKRHKNFKGYVQGEEKEDED